MLLIASAGVGFGHAIMPDHWAPMAVLARAQRTPLRRVLRQSSLAAVTHVVLSLLLGAVLILVGLRFRATVERHEDLIVGGILLATGAVFAVLELLGRGHQHRDGHGHEHHRHSHHSHERQSHEHQSHERHDHSHEPHDHEHHAHDHAGAHTARSSRDLLALIVPFGAAASPDLTILPVFLAAGALGGGAAAGSLAVFAAVTIATIVGMTLLTVLGGRLLTDPRIDRGANILTAGTLLLIGGLVAAGVL